MNLAETDRQQHINTIFPHLANEFVDITPHFTDETNKIAGVSFVPYSEAGTPTVHMEYALSENNENEIVAYRLRVPDETLIYQRRETQSGVPYGVFYGFEHPAGDDEPFELEISFGSAAAGKYKDPEDALGGVRYFADPPEIKEVIAGRVFSPDRDRESLTFRLGREDPNAKTSEWKGKTLAGKSEIPYWYKADNEGTVLTFRFQDPYTLVIKTIIAPLAFDRDKVAQVAFSETEYDQKTGIASVQWKQLESVLDAQLDYFNANYRLDEFKNPKSNQDIAIKITSKPPDPEVAPPSDTVIGKVKSNIALDPPATLEVDDIDRFLGNGNLAAQANHEDEPATDREINSTWRTGSSVPQTDLSAPQITIINEITKGNPVALAIRQPDEIDIKPDEDTVIKVEFAKVEFAKVEFAK